MKNLLLLLLSILSFNAFCQNDNLNINTLNAPSSPVFNLMGIELTDIERPKDPTDVFFSVRNATDGFATLPKNYSFELAPTWVFSGRNISYADFESSNPKHSIPQSFVISVGTRIKDKIDTAQYSQVGLGLKFTILRGKLSSDFIAEKKKLDGLLAKYNTSFADWSNAFEASDPTYLSLENIIKDDNTSVSEKVRVSSEMIRLKQEAFQKEQTNLEKQAKEVREQIKKLNFKRVGFLMDFAAASVIDFPTNEYINKRLGRAGFWLTAGYAPDKLDGLEFLCLARYLYTRTSFEFNTNNDSAFFNENTNYFDLGGKLYYNTWQGRLAVGFEGILRKSNIEPYPFWRYSLNLNFQVMPNRVISFTIGRDYKTNKPQSDFNKGLSEKDLFLALNLLMGFGNERPAN